MKNLLAVMSCDGSKPKHTNPQSDIDERADLRNL